MVQDQDSRMTKSQRNHVCFSVGRHLCKDGGDLWIRYNRAKIRETLLPLPAIYREIPLPFDRLLVRSLPL